MKSKDSSSSGMAAENQKIKEELQAVKKKLHDTEAGMDSLQEQILEKIETLVKAEKEKLSATEQLEKLKQEVKEIRESEEILNQ